MKLIDVLVKQANKEIKEGTILRIPDEELFGKKSEFEFKFYEDHFFSKEGLKIDELYSFDTDFLNSEVDLLISPKEKEYLISVHIKGLIRELTVLNYQRLTGKIHLGSPGNTNFVQTSFTKSEMKSIEPIREFLDDMKGMYTFIEVEL